LNPINNPIKFHQLPSNPIYTHYPLTSIKPYLLEDNSKVFGCPPPPLLQLLLTGLHNLDVSGRSRVELRAKGVISLSKMDQDGDFSSNTQIWDFTNFHEDSSKKNGQLKNSRCVSFGTGHPSHPMAKVVLEKMPLEYAFP
jgi:hypothetical protein